MPWYSMQASGIPMLEEKELTCGKVIGQASAPSAADDQTTSKLTPRNEKKMLEQRILPYVRGALKIDIQPAAYSNLCQPSLNQAGDTFRRPDKAATKSIQTARTAWMRQPMKPGNGPGDRYSIERLGHSPFSAANTCSDFNDPTLPALISTGTTFARESPQ